MQIPKIIHYCWFGRNPKPRLAEKCILSWKKFCPDYEIVEWNEDNFDLSAAPLYVRQAYEAKKWAFVTDYVRLKVVCDRGGIYMDTDVELVKSPDFLLNHQAYFGFEDPEAVNTGLGFGAQQNAPIIRNMMAVYEDLAFLQEDGSFDLTPCPERNTEILLQQGLKLGGTYQVLSGDILILPKDYLCPLDYESQKLEKTANTVSVHWFTASWQTKEEKKKKKQDKAREKRAEFLFQLTRLPNKIGMAVFGEQRYVKIRSFLKGQK